MSNKEKLDFGSDSTSEALGIMSIIFIGFSCAEAFDLGLIVSGLIGLAASLAIFLATHEIMKLLAKDGNFSPIRKVMNVIRIVIVLVVTVALMGIGSGGSSSTKKWSDLSDQEKDNARWAYYAQQAVEEAENK